MRRWKTFQCVLEAERTLREFNETLEEGIAERTAALTRANEDLQRAMHELAQSEKLAALGNLVAGVAHELNTPIGNALMVATTLEEMTATIATEISGDTFAGPRSMRM